jgi:hypothetical protein
MQIARSCLRDIEIDVPGAASRSTEALLGRPQTNDINDLRCQNALARALAPYGLATLSKPDCYQPKQIGAPALLQFF